MDPLGIFGAVESLIKRSALAPIRARCVRISDCALLVLVHPLGRPIGVPRGPESRRRQDQQCQAQRRCVGAMAARKPIAEHSER
jgi:hypothetical protein